MNIIVKQSNIHRRGVYALHSFRAGETVLIWDTSKRIDAQSASVISASGDYFVHPYDADSFFVVQSPECFVNHSCGNNTEVRNFTDVAIRDIAAGEEITSNYETDGAGLSFACQCGSPDCRGIIGKKMS